MLFDNIERERKRAIEPVDALVFIDGASSNNPGPAGCGVYIQFDKKTIELVVPIGIATNNVAEYMALLVAAYELKKLYLNHKLTVLDVLVHSDSELLVRQWNGLYRTKDNKIKLLQQEIRKILATAGFNLKLVHVSREKNKVADMLAKQAVEISRLVGQVAACKGQVLQEESPSCRGQGSG